MIDEKTELIKHLKKYGLTQNEAKVYIFLNKRKFAIVSKIGNNVKIPRTEIYGVLKRMEEKQIVTCDLLKHPRQYSIVSVEKALKIYIDNEIVRLVQLEKEISSICDLLNSVYDEDM